MPACVHRRRGAASARVERRSAVPAGREHLGERPPPDELAVVARRARVAAKRRERTRPARFGAAAPASAQPSASAASDRDEPISAPPIVTTRRCAERARRPARTTRGTRRTRATGMRVFVSVTVVFTCTPPGRSSTVDLERCRTATARSLAPGVARDLRARRELRSCQSVSVRRLRAEADVELARARATRSRGPCARAARRARSSVVLIAPARTAATLAFAWSVHGLLDVLEVARVDATAPSMPGRSVARSSCDALLARRLGVVAHAPARRARRR